MEYKISDIATVVMGGTPSTANPNYWNGNVLWVTPKDLSLLNGGKYIYTTLSTLTFEGLAHSSAKLLPPNSIILSTRAPVGYLAISAYEMSTNQGIKALIPKMQRLIPSISIIS